MYVCPQPVPPRVGQTYVTYQPFMPHEYMYKHDRSYYTYNQGAGWTRTNVRYGTCGNCLRRNLRRLALPDDEQHHGAPHQLLLPRRAVLSSSSAETSRVECQPISLVACDLRSAHDEFGENEHEPTNCHPRADLPRLTIAAPAPAASAAPNHWPVRRAWYYDWNKNYANTTYGQPVSLVVPPTATMQTNWGWGVGSSRLERSITSSCATTQATASSGGRVPHDAAFGRATRRNSASTTSAGRGNQRVTATSATSSCRRSRIARPCCFASSTRKLSPTSARAARRIGSCRSPRWNAG